MYSSDTTLYECTETESRSVVPRGGAMSITATVAMAISLFTMYYLHKLPFSWRLCHVDRYYSQLKMHCLCNVQFCVTA